MNRPAKFTIIGITTIILIGSFTACSHKYRDPEYRSHKMVEIVAQKLELNELQKSKLNIISDRMQASRNAMRDRFSANKDEFEKLLLQPTLDEKHLLNMVREHTQMMNQQAPEIVAAMADFYNSLSPDQRTELRQHIEQMQEHHHGRHKHEHHG